MPRRWSMFERERYDASQARSDAFAHRAVISPELVAAVRHGDVASAALALREQLTKGGYLPTRVRVAIKATNESGRYEDDQRAVQLARDAFVNLDSAV